MKMRLGRIVGTVLAATLAAGSVAAFAMPAGGSVAEKNTKFCKVLGDTSALIGENAGTPEAGKVAVKLYKRASKVAGIPSKVKAALQVVVASYQRIVDGKPAVTLATDRKFLRSTRVVSSYVRKTCVVVPST